MASSGSSPATSARSVASSTDSPSASRWSLGLITRVLLAVSGLCFGQLVDHITHGPSASGIAVANATAPYGLILGMLAVLRSRPSRAAIDAAVFFSAFVTGYYLTLARQFGVTAVDRHYAGVWLLLAAAACPAIAALVCWARARPGGFRALVFALPAGAACTEVLSDRTWGMANRIDPVVIALDGVLMLFYLVVLPRGAVTKAAAIVWCAPVVGVLLLITTSLANDGAYARWMY